MAAIDFALAALCFGFALVALGYALYVKYLAPKFTRERFAIAALAAVTALALPIVLSLLSTQAPWVILFNVAAELLGLQARVQEAGFAEKMLAVAVLAFLLLWMRSIFLGWSGGVSQLQHQDQCLALSPSMTRDGLRELKRLLLLRPGFERHDPTSQNGSFPPILAPTDSLAWRDQAREMHSIIRRSHRFDPHEGWHEAHDLWVGDNVRSGACVALMAVQTPPSAAELNAAIDYVRSLPGSVGRQVEFSVVYRDGGPDDAIGAVQGVEYRSRSELVGALVNFDDYIAHIVERVERECLPDSDLHVKDTYVPSRLSCMDGRELEGDFEAVLCNWLREPPGRNLVILGEYGQGKSTGALMFTYHLLKDFGNAPVIPILIELRGKSPASLKPLELLATWASLYRIEPRAIMTLLRAGRLVLILDGFDEMADATTTEARFNHFSSLWQLSYPEARLVFTGRPNFFLGERELNTVLEVGNDVGSPPYCTAYTLVPFDLDQVARGLRNFPAQVTDGIVELARNDAQFLDIISRPSLLYVVAVLWQTPEFSRASTRVMNSGTILSQFIRHSYRRQTQKARASNAFMPLTEAERAFFMSGIAVYMAQKGWPNQISRAECEQIVARLFENFPEELDDNQDVRHGATARPLKARMADNPDAREVIFTDVRTYGILVDDVSRTGHYRFAHKSFFEVLVARHFLNMILKKKTEETRRIAKVCGDTMVPIANMPQALRFAGDMMSAFTGSDVSPSELFDIIVAGNSSCTFIGRRFMVSIVYNGNVFKLASMPVVAIGGGFLSSFVEARVNGAMPVGSGIAITFISVSLYFGAGRLLDLDGVMARIRMWAAVCRSRGVPWDELEAVCGKRMLIKLKDS